MNVGRGFRAPTFNSPAYFLLAIESLGIELLSLLCSLKEFSPAKRHIEVSVGESARMLRELQVSSQNELADISGIPQSTISAIENDRVSLGVERVKTLARALKCHPAVLLFPGWDVEVESAA